MHSPYPDVRDAYCVRCLFPADERARMCGSCGAPFVGSGAFDVMRGPRPSSLFGELLRSSPVATAAGEGFGRGRDAP